MGRFVARRLIGSALITLAAITLVFVVLNILPGDPAEAALSDSSVPRAVIESRRAALGLNQPLWVQYLHYLGRLTRGDLGVSWASGQPVSMVIEEQLPSTIALAIAGMLIALLIGTVLGVWAVRGPWNQVARFISASLLAIPVMLSGTILVGIFSLGLGWFPAGGQGTLKHLVLPALVIGLSVGSAVARAVDAGLSEALRQPFLRAARAKGLSNWQALWRHAMRPAMLPVLEMITLQFGYLLGGTVVTEALFARQGIGRVLVSAVLSKDLPVVQGVVILSVTTYSLLHIISDTGAAWLDPRIRFEAR